jgi:HlyD family secretion protein
VTHRSPHHPRVFIPRLASTAAVAALILAACNAPPDRPLPGYIEGEYVRVAAPFAGTLQRLAVQRGQAVAAGAPMFALERENEVAARNQAEQQ